MCQVRKYVKSELSPFPHWVPRRISRVLRAMLKWDPAKRPTLRQVRYVLRAAARAI